MSTYRSNQDTAFCCNRGDHPGHTEARMTTYEEWRVTGQPNTYRGVEFPPYDFTWSLRTNPHLGDPEQAARKFVDGILSHEGVYGGWTDGPHLHRRTVTVTEWEAVE